LVTLLVFVDASEDSIMADDAIALLNPFVVQVEERKLD
jgi:hypothetical protein